MLTHTNTVRCRKDAGFDIIAQPAALIMAGKKCITINAGHLWRMQTLPYSQGKPDTYHIKYAHYLSHWLSICSYRKCSVSKILTRPKHILETTWSQGVLSLIKVYIFVI